MNPEETARIKETLREKTSDELLDIWTKNDRSVWADEVFGVIRDLLKSRNVPLPNQRIYSPQIVIEKKLASEKESNKGLLFIVSGIVVVLFSYFTGMRIFIPVGLILVGIFIVLRVRDEK